MIRLRRAWIVPLAASGALASAFACGTDSENTETGAPTEASDAANTGAGEPLADGGSALTRMFGDAATEADAAPLPTSDEVITMSATSLGLAAFSANGRIQPHGYPTQYYFEYGATTDYGLATNQAALGPRLEAHYSEAWADGLNGWRSGGDADDLKFIGVDGGAGYAHFAEPVQTDYNHLDGIGGLHLCKFFYAGLFDSDSPSAAFGGADPDMRDAKVKIQVRGTNWVPNGSELLWWSQVDVNHGRTPADTEFTASNWAHTGFTLTDFLFSGNWENVEYRLNNTTTDWTYGGQNRGPYGENQKDIYKYAPLDDVLGHLDVDFFHLLAYVDDNVPPSGEIDFRNIDITYRNHSLLRASNGGTLVSAPAGGDDTALLTDGWRNGNGHVWRSAPNPDGYLEFVYSFEQPVAVDRVQIHQNPTWPSKDIEVMLSPDDVNWYPVIGDTLPKSSPLGPNFTYHLTRDINILARRVLVRVLNGYQSQYWGLGEIEVFGRGAVKKTDDAWYNVNTDITGLKRGATYHYRLVALVDGKPVRGNDQVFTVPATESPEVVVGPASRIANGRAKVDGRMNSFGEEAFYAFEYGPTIKYGKATPLKRTGKEITPRTVVGALEGLAPGSTVHYRLVAYGTTGTRYSGDATFVAK